jgi:hypothetical protein
MGRKKANIHYLYKTTCLITNRYYIGMHSTTNLEDGYMGSGTRLRRSIRKYGVENHKKEILEFFETRELLIEAEKKAITSDMINDVNCMNLKPGGTGGFSSKQQIENAIKSNIKQKILRETNKEWVTHKQNAMKKTIKEQYENGRVFIGRYDSTGAKHSEDTKKLMSLKKQGYGFGSTNSQHNTCWITKNGENKKIKKGLIDSYIKDGWVKGRTQSLIQLMNLKQNK